MSNNEVTITKLSNGQFRVVMSDYYIEEPCLLDLGQYDHTFRKRVIGYNKIFSKTQIEQGIEQGHLKEKIN